MPSDIYQQGQKLFYSPTPGTYQAISDPNQLQTLAKQGAVKVGSPYLPLPAGSVPVGASPTPPTAQVGIQQPAAKQNASTATTAPSGSLSATTGGSNIAFQQAFGQLMQNAQKNQGLQDQMYALIKAKYDNNPQITPDMPLAVQQAIQNRDQSMIDFQIQALRSQIQGRSTDMTNSLQYLVAGYQSDAAAALQKQQDANKTVQGWITTFGSNLQQAGITQDELNSFLQTNQMSPDLASKLMSVSTLTQTKNEAAQNKPFIIGQATDSSGNKVNVYGVNVQDPKTGAWSVKQVSGPDVPVGGQGGSAIWTDPVSKQSYDWSTYAVNNDGSPNLQAVANINSALSTIGDSFTGNNVAALSDYLNTHTMGGVKSPVTADMIQKASEQYGVSWEALTAVLQSESHFGTDGARAIQGMNPGNVGNTNTGAAQSFSSWQDGVNAAAKQLADRQTSATPQTTKVPGTTGSPTIDTSPAGYASTPVAGAGGLTQAAIDQAALQYVTTGTMPSIGLGSTGPGGQRKTAIENRAGELSSGGNIAANKAQLKALTSSLTKQTDYANTVERSVSNAESGFEQLMGSFKDSGINTSSSPLLNKSMNEVAKNITGGSIFAFNAGLTEVGNEYANVFSRGGQVTDTVRNKANDITNGNISLKDLLDVQKELQAQGGIIVQGAKKQVQQIQDQINGIVSGSSDQGGSGSTYKGFNLPY